MVDSGSIARLAVVICTRDRGDSIRMTLESTLAAGGELQEVVVIDQSRSDATMLAVQPFLSDGRLRYVRSAQQGLSNARNQGLAEVTSGTVLLTDDDCVVPAGYAALALKCFADFPEAAGIFLHVKAAPHDAEQGSVPAFTPDAVRELTSISSLTHASGIGAGLLIRRDIVQAIGGFDAFLGAGAPFRSAEDVDLTVRLLLFGYRVVEFPDLEVVHHGFRSREEFRALVRRDWFGIGAAYAKPMRTRYWARFAPIIAADVWRRSLFPFVKNVARLRLHGIASLVAFARGYWAGCRQPIDRSTLVYESKS